MRLNSKLFLVFGVVFLLVSVVTATDDEDADCDEDMPQPVEEESSECSSEEKQKPPPKQKCKGQNEEWSKCVSPCGERCSNLGQDVVCNFLVCNPGCDCKPGFFRNEENVCVPPEECCCKENEEFEKCWNPCPPQTCADIGKLVKCAPACKPACKCKWNHRRDSKGVCIPIQKCPPLKCTGKNEVFNSCPASCLDENCKTLEDPLMCIAIARECQPACICKPDHRRNKDGKCVPIKECPCKDPNAEVVSCPNPCPGGNCDSPTFAPCKAACRLYGCQCKKGYVKKSATDPTCIKQSECPKKCGKNETYKIAASCRATCSNRNPPCNKMGVPGCYCNDGYILDKDKGKCILISSCPKKKDSSSESCEKECGKNEQYSECGANGCQNTCKNPTLSHVCKAMCIAGCICKDGYLRNSKNQCVLPKDCDGKGDDSKSDSCSSESKSGSGEKPPKCGKNQEYKKCGTACPGTCDKPTRPCTKQCVAGCFCKDGFILDKEKGNCIPKDKCPKKCGENEVYNSCGTACRPTCQKPNPICTKQCAPGCYCKPDYILDKEKGKCIPKKKCPKDDSSNESDSCSGEKKCGKNEEWNKCGTTCRPTCANKQPVCNKKCVAGCFCKKDYILNKDKGQCIPVAKCPKEKSSSESCED